MSKEQHISESQFIQILHRRMDEYFVGITGNEGSSSRAMHFKTAQRINIQNVQTQAKKSNLYNSGFWGYGINSISDGTEIHSSLDVEDFKRIQGLNKHQNEHRLFWLLTFKIEDESLFVSIFCVDTARFNVNSNINTKYELKDFKNTRLRMRGNTIYIDIFFNNLDKPIHFQLDTYAQGGKLSGQQLAEYYIEQITRRAETIKSKHQTIEDAKIVRSELEIDVDRLEIKLRELFVNILEKETGKDEYQDIITGSPKTDLRRRIKKHVDLHPEENIEDYNLLKNAIQFADIEHLKLIILKDANWNFFQPIFQNKIATEKYFNQLSQLRHTLKHSRKLTDLVRLEGMASLEWFNQIK